MLEEKNNLIAEFQRTIVKIRMPESFNSEQGKLFVPNQNINNCQNSFSRL